MEFLALINRTNPFQILGLLGGKFQFLFKFLKYICNPTVQNRIRRRILQRLIRFFTVCRCSIKWTLGLNRLRPIRQNFLISQLKHMMCVLNKFF